MLVNQWYVVLESKQVKAGKLLGVKRLDKSLVFYREPDGTVVCMEDKCSHRGVKLSIGQLSENCVTCPFHGFEFNSQGECLKIPANGQDSKVSKRFNVRTYPTYESNDFIFIYNGQEPTTQPEYFDNLENMPYKTSYNIWETHYSRAIENQLDVVHVPFVHKKTIGRGNKTLVNGPATKIDNDKMTIYVYNQVDKGQKPLKAAEMTDFDHYFKLKFIMPNLWQNQISDKLKVVAAFAPIDDTHTMIYLRTYQAFVKVPVIKRLVLNAIGLYNIKILNEDKRVVITQTPLNTHMELKENLIPGDLPIGQYRRMAKQIIEENQQESSK